MGNNTQEKKKKTHNEYEKKRGKSEAWGEEVEKLYNRWSVLTQPGETVEGKLVKAKLTKSMKIVGWVGEICFLLAFSDPSRRRLRHLPVTFEDHSSMTMTLEAANQHRRVEEINTRERRAQVNWRNKYEIYQILSKAQDFWCLQPAIGRWFNDRTKLFATLRSPSRCASLKNWIPFLYDCCGGLRSRFLWE